MVGAERVSVGVRGEQRVVVGERRERHVRREVVLGPRDREACRVERPAKCCELSPVDSLEAHVEPRPARHTVDVLDVAAARERVEGVPVELDFAVDLAEHTETPSRQVDRRDASGMEHRPLLGHVLPRRQPSRVEARVADLLFRARPEHAPYTSQVASVATKTYLRPRAYVCVRGPQAADLLQRIVSNDILGRESCEALILTPKGRVIAPLVVWRRGEDDFLLLTEPELGEVVRSHLVRLRVAARCEIELEHHVSAIVFGGAEGIPTSDYGLPAVEMLDGAAAPEPIDEDLERLRILACTPRWGSEIDDAILPAEAGLDERAVSFSKGCFPGQEPLARLNARGHVNRRLRTLSVDGEAALPGDEVRDGERSVGRVTSAVPGLALGYLRTDVPDDAALEVAGRPARIH
jgi:folate-binding protein YgfZ